jgi:hypothetical protein
LIRSSAQNFNESGNSGSGNIGNGNQSTARVLQAFRPGTLDNNIGHERALTSFYEKTMNTRAEEKLIKTLNVISSWREYCLETNYPDYNRLERLYLQTFDFERCILAVSSVTITKVIRILTDYYYLEIHSIMYILDNGH